MRKSQKIISFLLALVMVIGMVPPMEARAEETEPTVETVAVETVAEETVVETIAATESVIEPVLETTAATEPVEETTVPTEVATEPTEETTAPTVETIPEEIVSSNAMGAAAATSGICGDNLTWSFNESTGTLSISGTGAMTDYAFTVDSPWDDLYREITTVVIGNGITRIGNYAFEDCCYITYVSIPNTVTAIGANAFDNCWRITDVNIPSSVTVIEEYAFANCSGLESISIPGSVATIGKDAFSRCWRMTSATIANGVTDIGESAFYNCYRLTGVSIPGSVVSIGEMAFSGCEAMTSLTLSDGLITIGAGAFMNTAFTGVRIPHTVTVIGDSVFRNTKLTGITIPDSVITIGTSAFGFCDDLSRVTLGKNVQTIGYGAFESNGKLTEIELPDSIVEIKDNAFECTGLTSITIPDSVTELSDYVFDNCEDLTRVTLPDTIVSIGSCAFSCCISLPEIEIPDSVETIGGHAFKGCTELTEVIIPNSVTTMGNDVFNSCTKLERVTLSNKMTQISSGTFWKCSSLTSVTVPRRITEIESQAFQACTSLSSIVLPGVTHINRMAFRNCSGLTSITLSKKLYDVSQEAFSGCTSMTDVYYEGRAEDWEKVIIYHSNSSLTGATFHYNVTIPAEDYYDFKVTPEKKEYTIKSRNKLQFTFNLYCNGELVTDWTHPTVTMNENNIVREENWMQVDSGWQLTLMGAAPGQDTVKIWDSRSGEKISIKIKVVPGPLTEYPVNSDIKLNDSGHAYAFYQGDPDTMYIYTLDGFPNDRGTAQSQADGVIRIDLGHYVEHGTFEGKITFTAVSPVDSIDVVELDQPKTFDIKVTVTPLEFSQKWSVSMDVGAGFSFGPGVEFDLEVPILGSFKGEAALAKLEGSTEKGHAINISRSCSGGKDVLEITSEEADRAKVGVKSGIDGTILKADVDVVSAGTETESTNTGIYGFRIRDFSPDNDVQRNAIGVYLLNEAMKSSPNQLAFQDFLKAQAEKAYKEANLDVISGTGAAVSSSFSAGAGEIKIGHATILEGVKEEGSTTISVGRTKYSDGEKKYTSAFAFDKTFYALRNPQIDGTIAQNYFGKEITLEAQEASGEKALETTSLSAEAGHSGSFTIGREYTTDYNRYRFTEKSLDELTASSAGIRSYLSGNQYAIGDDEIEDVGNILSKGENPVEYSNVEKKQKLSSHELGFDGQVIIGLELGTTLSFLQENEHTNASGFVVEDRKLETSRSDDLTTKISEKSFTLSKFLSDAVNSLTQKITDFFTQVTGTIKDGAQTLWNRVTGNPGSTVNGIVTLCTPSGADPWPHSHTLDISGTGGKQAVTMGRPAIISITDNETGEAITDLSNEPLTFTMRYAAEELAALGGQVPAMYRCSDDGKNLEYIGGVCNETDMTVTAEITKPGQYVLAVELHDDGSQEDSEETAAKILLDKDAVILKVGETAQLTAEVQRVELTNSLIWSVSDDSVINIDQDGVVTARKQGTAYAIAAVTEGETKFTARCRVDVVEPEVEEQEKPIIRLNGVQLGTTKLTTELFSTDYAQFELLLELPQNDSAVFAMRRAVPAHNGVAIERAEFADAAAADAFELIPLDDRRIAVVPTEYALECPKELKKSYKSAVTVWVDGEDYTTDEILTLTVKQSKPKLKAKIDTFNSFYTNQTQEITITGGTATGITVKSLPNWLTPNEDFTLSLNENAGTKNSGKAVLLVETEEWNIPAEVTLSVKNAYKAPGLKLNTTSVKIAESAAKAGINLQLQPKSKKDTLKSLDVADVLPPEGYKVEGFNSLTGSFTLKAENGFQSGKITLQVKIDGTTETVPLMLKVEIVKKNISVSFKASGNLDLSLPNHTVTVKPTFKNYNGSFTFEETETDQLKLKQDGNVISVQCKDGTETGTYKLTLKLVLDDDITVENTVKITVKRTAIKLKLSSSKLSLNKSISDMASVTVTCTTKGYDLAEPIVKVMDKTDKVASNGLDAAYSNGKLTVSVNENTEYGATYKVQVRAYEGAPVAALTVTILKENKSAITASLKAKGSIDVIRNGTAITLTPSYKNAGNLTEKVEKLEFFKTVKKETTSADGLFAYTRNTDGTYTITKAEGAALDHSAKYSVKLVSTIGSTAVESKTVSLTVKQGSAKLTLKSGSNILFSRDSRSRVNFSLTAKDVQLNDIKEVTSKDVRFVVYSYGNGEFALGFANNTVDERLKSKTVTVTLNIFLKGNETAKANTTAKLKVTILK